MLFFHTCDHGDLRTKFTIGLMNEMNKYRKHGYDRKVHNVLRFQRNYVTHIGNVVEKERKILGTDSDKLEVMFRTYFPGLMKQVYVTMERVLRTLRPTLSADEKILYNDIKRERVAGG